MIRWMITVMMAFVISTVSAQDKSLSISTFFGEKVAASPGVTIVKMKGNPSGWRGVSYLSSISIVANDSLADRLSEAVRKDGAKAKSKETSLKEGKLYFGFYSLTPKAGEDRYLFFLDKRPSGQEKTTLIYISGELTEEEVKRNINNKNK